MSVSQNKRLRVGSVPFLVGRPLDLGLGEEPGIELSYAPPARLVEGLRRGDLDVALTSSIELFRQPGYRYLADYAVCGAGEVGSVQVFVKKPIDEVRSIAMDPNSRTAATLVRVLLAGRPQGPPEYIECARDEDPRKVEADAWLRIGDLALRETYEDPAPQIFNPSAEWTQRTGLPFIFAPWIVRPGVDMDPWLDSFARARARGEERRQRLASEASRLWDLSLEACEHYLLRECSYDTDERMADALRAFRDGAAPLGLCHADLDPRPIRGEARVS